MSDRNPFQPPRADVEDPSSGFGPRPDSVKHACAIVLISFAIGVLTQIPGVRPEPLGEAEIPFWINAALFLVFGALTLWLVSAVYSARNWGRWSLLVYLGLTWLLGVGLVMGDLQSTPILALIDLACIGMEVVACGLLFFGPGGKWFRARHPAAPGGNGV